MREAEVAIAAVDRADLEALGRATEADWPALAAYSAEWIALDMPDAPRASTAWAAVHLPSPTPDAIAEARRALDLPEPADVTEHAMWHVLRMWARYVLTSAE